MKRSDLEHILRASKGVTGEAEFIVIGSQAIPGRFPDAPRVLRQSMEADLHPRYRSILMGTKMQTAAGRVCSSALPLKRGGARTPANLPTMRCMHATRSGQVCSTERWCIFRKRLNVG
jgi:hypothetical protein